MKKLMFAMLMVLLGGGMAAFAGQPDDDGKNQAQVPAHAAAKQAKPKTDAVKKAEEDLDGENESLKRAESALVEALKRESEALEEAQKLAELQAQQEFVKKLRKQAEYQAKEAEKRAKRAVLPEADQQQAPVADKSDAENILEIIRARCRCRR